MAETSTTYVFCPGCAECNDLITVVGKYEWGAAIPPEVVGWMRDNPVKRCESCKRSLSGAQLLVRYNGSTRHNETQ